MNITLTPGSLSGTIPTIASKSYAHRLLICAALAKDETYIACRSLSEDIVATMRCLPAMGMEAVSAEGGFLVRPTKEVTSDLFCGESGSTYRFLLPVACALGLNAAFHLEGRLPERPMEEFFSALEQGGTVIKGKGTPIVTVRGKLKAGKYTLPGNISSQYITGLLFALPLLCGDSEILLTTPMESKGYIAMTLSAISQFGIQIKETKTGFLIPGNQQYRSPKNTVVEGDWSNAAFFLTAGAFSEKGIAVTGLNLDSYQGDKEILSILSRFGADISCQNDTVTVKKGALRGITLDAGDIPDLIPAIAAAAAAAEGVTRIENAGRLRLKESDRLSTVAQTVTDLGGQAAIEGDTLLITGTALKGGTVSSYNDHRIAMMAAIASAVCSSSVTITDAQAVKKSYPDFFSDLASLKNS